jgi:hypothetical protein
MRLSIAFNEIILIIICQLLFTTCKKTEEDQFDFGDVKVLVNGQIYEGETFNSCCDGQNKLIFTFGQQKIKKLSKDFSFASDHYEVRAEKIFGKQIIKNCDTFRDTACHSSADLFTNIDDGDVIGDVFKINESAIAENYIEITQEANDFKEIWGNFRMELIRKQKDPNSPYPDTLHFTNGEFHLKFK